MTDKLDDIEADLATTNPDAVTVTIPRKHIEWLIAEVKRLRNENEAYVLRIRGYEIALGRRYISK